MFADLHVKKATSVDLNSRAESINFEIIKEVVEKSKLQIEVGGVYMARLDVDMGVSYAILGTVVKNPGFVIEAAKNTLIKLF